MVCSYRFPNVTSPLTYCHFLSSNRYFIDVSRTWHCPKPAGNTHYSDADRQKFQKQRELHKYAREQLLYNMDLVKPGMGLKECAEKSWKIPERFVGRRYGIMAHGNGINGEYPYIYHAVDWPASGYDGVVEEGMTLSFEVGDDVGVNIFEEGRTVVV